jgi:hypothetical protein
MCLPILQLSCRLFGKTSHHRGLSAPLQPRFGSMRLLVFPKAKLSLKLRRYVNATVTQYTSSVNGLTADWLAPRGSDCSRMHSEVSSDRLPSYIKVTIPILEIFKWMDIFRTGLLRRMGKPYRTGRVCCRSLEEFCVKYFWSDKHKKNCASRLLLRCAAEVGVGFNLNLSLLLSDFHQSLNIKISVKISNINL